MKKHISILITGLLLCLPITSQSKVLDRVKAVIGTTPILQSDVENRHNLIKNSPVYSNILGIDPKNFTDTDTLNLIIEEQVISNVTEELNAAVSEADVQKQIDQIAKQNNISRDQLIDSLKSEGIPFEAYASNIRAQLQKRTIFERELRSSSAPNDAELRKEYYKLAKPEYSLFILEAPSKDHKKILESFKKRETRWDDLTKKYTSTELGWFSPDNLTKELATPVSKASTGDLLGPLKVGTQTVLVFVSAERRGSEEEFEKVKGGLAAQAQASSFNERFRSWLDAKMKTMQIVVNK